MKSFNFSIDINCDVGEGADNEAQLFPLISSCNIACGGHAGDVDSMERVVRLAKKYQVKVGAHPSYPDRANFGRSAMAISPESLIHSIREQVSTLTAILQKEGIGLHHIKAHGALYHEIAKNTAQAENFLQAASVFGKDILIYAPYASTIGKKAIEHGFSTAREAFADRNYKADLSLVSRKHP
ncbi:MAG TPA: LamB/YcsF family protein, partial [Pricia sp.]|nr:LamB/YcsF family protein [Pricia sp.]